MADSIKDMILAEREVLKVGKKVYRVKYNDIEEGKISLIRVGKVVDDFRLILEGEGDDWLYYADFGREYEAQMYQWKWFISEKRARQKLNEKFEDDIEELHKKIEKKQKLKAENETRIKRLRK